METVATTAPMLVTEVIDYTPVLVQIEEHASLLAEHAVLVTGFLLFFVVVILCYFVYKFFRIFF